MVSETDYKHLFPIAVAVEQGNTYRWCSCGKSAIPPLCENECCGDKAVTFVATLTEEVYFCNCKQTQNPPWCDGSHGKLLLEAVKNKHHK